MKFEIEEAEEKTLNEIINAIKVLYGSSVDYDIVYCFTNGSIGRTVEVIIKSREKGLFEFKKDITYYDAF